MRIPIGTIASSLSKVKLWFSRFSSSVIEEYTDLAVDTEGNGTSLAVGYRQASDGSRFFGIMTMYAADGSVLWKKEKSDTTYVRFSGATYLPSNTNSGTAAHWFVCGYQPSSGLAYIIKVDMSGNVVWERSVSDVGDKTEIVTSNAVGYPRICSDNESTIYVSYSTHFDSYIGLSKYASNGNRIWSKRYYTSGWQFTSYDVAYNLYHYRVTIVGSVFTGDTYRRGFLANINQDGVCQTFTTFSMSGSSRHTVFTGITTNNTLVYDWGGGEYALVGWYDNNNASNRTTVFSKFNLNNGSYTPAFERNFQFNSYWTSGNSVALGQDYIYIGASTQPDASTPKKQSIIKLSSGLGTSVTPQVLTHALIGSYYSNPSLTTEITRTGKLVLTNNALYTSGFMAPSGSRDALIAKLDRTMSTFKVFDNDMDGSREGNIAFSYYNMGNSLGNHSWTAVYGATTLLSANQTSSFGSPVGTYTTLSSSLEYGIAKF